MADTTEREALGQHLHERSMARLAALLGVPGPEEWAAPEAAWAEVADDAIAWFATRHPAPSVSAADALARLPERKRWPSQDDIGRMWDAIDTLSAALGIEVTR